MGKRLHVLLEEEEFREICRIAERQHVTVAAWVRQALLAACQKEASADVQRKLQIVRAAFAHAGPTGDIDQMLAEIGQDHVGRKPPA